MVARRLNVGSWPASLMTVVVKRKSTEPFNKLCMMEWWSGQILGCKTPVQFAFIRRDYKYIGTLKSVPWILQTNAKVHVLTSCIFSPWNICLHFVWIFLTRDGTTSNSTGFIRKIFGIISVPREHYVSWHGFFHENYAAGPKSVHHRSIPMFWRKLNDFWIQKIILCKTCKNITATLWTVRRRNTVCKGTFGVDNKE